MMTYDNAPGKAPQKLHRHERRRKRSCVQVTATIALLGLLSGFSGTSTRAGASGGGDHAPSNRFSCQVAYVHDGDTLRCEDGTRIRLHAVAAREADETCTRGHPCPAATAAASKAALERLVGGLRIDCRRVGRSYNRITAICWTPEGVEVNCAMIRSGTTVVWERFNRERPICSGRAL